MKTLFLVRHAKSSWKDSSLRDIDRPLNKRGLRDAPFMAKMLKAKEPSVDALLISPSKRTRLTAQYFATEFEIPTERIHIDKRIYEFSAGSILGVIKEFSKKWDTVMLFGHNPDMTSLANYFSSNYISNVPTCGILKITADIEHWEDFDEATASLVAFHYPKQHFD